MAANLRKHVFDLVVYLTRLDHDEQTRAEPRNGARTAGLVPTIGPHRSSQYIFEFIIGIVFDWL